jgi:hypothetical protein
MGQNFFFVLITGVNGLSHIPSSLTIAFNFFAFIQPQLDNYQQYRIYINKNFKNVVHGIFDIRKRAKLVKQTVENFDDELTRLTLLNHDSFIGDCRLEQFLPNSIASGSVDEFKDLSFGIISCPECNVIQLVPESGISCNNDLSEQFKDGVPIFSKCINNHQIAMGDHLYRNDLVIYRRGSQWTSKPLNSANHIIQCYDCLEVFFFFNNKSQPQIPSTLSCSKNHRLILGNNLVDPGVRIIKSDIYVTELLIFLPVLGSGTY